MKKILLLLATLLMIANAAFAMTGVIEPQTINNVSCSSTPNEVIEKWGQPIGEGNGYYYFNPGGLSARCRTHTIKKVTYVAGIRAENNPNLVLQPSGVRIGMREEEVRRRLGNPDRELSKYLNETHGFCVEFVYREPESTLLNGLLKGHQDVLIWIGDDDTRQNKGQVVAIWLDTMFY